MRAEVPLDRLQRWMQQVVVHPGTVEEALLDPAAQAEVPRASLEEVILPSARLTASERVGIYQGMYLLRMEEALAGDYPALKHFLGEQRFFALVRAYVQEHPSRHFSLNRLGDHLPAFIERRGGVPRPSFCADLARLELAVTLAFDAPQAEPLSPEPIAAVPPEQWEGMRLVPVPAVRLLALRYPVTAYLDHVHDETDARPPMRRKATWVLIYRRDHSVFRLSLERDAHALLSDLLDGRTLGDAVAAVLARPGRRRPQADDLFRWFRSWVAAGVFASVHSRVGATMVGSWYR